MDLQISGKRALVTGGGKGIGRAIADVLADEGCDLVLVGRDQAALDAASKEIRGRCQVNVETISADLSSEATVRKVAKQAGAIDILGEKHPAGYIAGAAGNAALIGFTRALAHGSHPDGIRVLGINPGAIATERAEMMARTRAREQFGDEERWPDMYKSAPFGRAGTPAEIANTVAFFASPLSGYTSGTVLTIDGGRD